ncbi:MAG: hypothetical protein ABSH36_04530 [Solirubrobacteraceae bacterium]
MAWLVVSLIAAAAAHGLGLTPIPISPVTVAVPAAKAVASAPLKLAVSALLSVLEAIFGGVEAKLITGVINDLLAIPNFDTGHVAELERTTVAIAAGMLSAVLTLSILRYYLAGLSDSGSGGFEAVQGLIRVVAAIGFIIAWPGVFSELIQIPKMFDGALLGSGSVQHNVALLFDAALVVGAGAFALGTGLGLIFVVVMGFISAVVFVALLWMKVLLGVMMMFLYVSMPLCVVLWPIQELAWLAAAALRAMSVGLMVPCVWAILFALSSAVNADVLSWAPSHSIIDTVIIRPLAGITLMLLCITIPRFLMRTAMIGPHGNANGGWRIWRTVTFGMFAMRGVAGVGRTVATAAMEGQPAAQRMIDALPSPLKPPTEPGQGGLASRVIFGRSAFTTDNQTASASKPTGEGSTTSPGSTGEAQQAPAGHDHDSDVRPQRRLAGLAPAQYDRERIERAGEQMYAQAGSDPSSVSDVSDAMAKLPAETQRAISAFRSNDEQKLRDLIAHNLDSPSLTGEQRQALWTIGTARNHTVSKGVNAALLNLKDEQAASTETPTAKAPNVPQEPPSSEVPGDRKPPFTAGSPGAPGGGVPPAPGLQGPPADSEGDTRSLGADLPRQPPPPPPPPPGDGERRKPDDPGLTDIEPFLD